MTHGTVNSYTNLGCRCNECRIVSMAYNKPKVLNSRRKRRLMGGCWDCSNPAIEGKSRCVRHMR